MKNAAYTLRGIYFNSQVADFHLFAMVTAVDEMRMRKPDGNIYYFEFVGAHQMEFNRQLCGDDARDNIV